MAIFVLALVLATLFAGAALYITLVEHPARMLLQYGPLLAQWQPSYQRALPIQAGLAVAGGAAGLVAAWLSMDWRWAVGSVVLLANWPFTLLVIMPVNKQLQAISPAQAGPESRGLLERWGRLHAVRSLLGSVAVLVFAVAIVFPAG